METRRSASILPSAIGGIIEDVFHQTYQKYFGDENWNASITAPVNILARDDHYEMQLIAPGLKKVDIRVHVEDQVLHVEYAHKEEDQEQQGKYLRKEYKLETFRRSFKLNNKIDPAMIKARYAEGILTVQLPKKPNQENGQHQIQIEG